MAGSPNSTPEQRKIWARNYYEKNKDKINMKSLEYQKLHPRDRSEYSKEYSKQWRENNQKEYKERTFRASGINLTYEEYIDLLEEQKGLCLICGGNRTNKILQVDHNHETGNVRGLLCSKCNTLLGMADDNIDILLSAIQYLRNDNNAK